MGKTIACSTVGDAAHNRSAPKYNKAPKAPWGLLVANAYYNADNPAYAALAGQRVANPYKVFTLDGVRVGVFGLTTQRGPQVVGNVALADEPTRDRTRVEPRSQIEARAVLRAKALKGAL